MKVILRSNAHADGDWRELATEGLGDISHRGHHIPEHVWVELLRAAGVEVEEVPDAFDG